LEKELNAEVVLESTLLFITNLTVKVKPEVVEVVEKDSVKDSVKEKELNAEVANRREKEKELNEEVANLTARLFTLLVMVKEKVSVKDSEKAMECITVK
jgi:uncharacterized protein YlxW (UPF0749 family)